MAFAQLNNGDFKVSGNCGMYKSKIEKAAKEAGAKDASWDADKQEITVTTKVLHQYSKDSAKDSRCRIW